MWNNLSIPFETMDVDILVNGRPIRKYTHQGQLYIESKHDVEYSIRIRNSAYVRKLLVVSVDGINVLNGEAAGASKAGYVINGLSATEIRGFRVSNDEVHPFKFSAKRHSYAAKSDATGGDTTNCGVIGVQVYDEYMPAPKISFTQNRSLGFYSHNHAPINASLNLASTITSTCDSYIPEYGASDRSLSDTQSSDSRTRMRSTSLEKPRGFDMGTEFSKESVTDRVVDVEFQIGSLSQTHNIYYASSESLIEMGVQLTKQTQVARPEAFPTKFCKPPGR